jgi:hypothetical protein
LPADKEEQSDKGALSLSDILVFIPQGSADNSPSTHPVSTVSKLIVFSTTSPYSLELVPPPSPVPPLPSMRSSLYLIAATTPALAAIKDVFWDITYVDNVNPDGLFERRAIGVNGTWP